MKAIKLMLSPIRIFLRITGVVLLLIMAIPSFLSIVVVIFFIVVLVIISKVFLLKPLLKFFIEAVKELPSETKKMKK